MYTPKHYRGGSKEEAIAFMKRFNFASMVTAIEGLPVATHLPFVVLERDNQIVLSSHMAKANDHWKHIVANDNLIIFSEPHAYISPKHYNQTQNVPTWNYMSIHAYGKANVIEGTDQVLSVLEGMIDSFEEAYRAQWEKLSDEYKVKMANGVVAFEIIVDRMDHKEKLSQNKKENERQAIIESLSKSEDSNAQIIGEYMTKKDMQ